jgi:hypothetical protein
MPDTRTPGEIAYAAYVTAVEQRRVDAAITTAMWARLRPAEQRAWEATALAARVWARQAPSSRWLVVPQAEEETR